MGKHTIYLPDKLQAELKGTQINVSAVCAAALEKEKRKGHKINLHAKLSEELRLKLLKEKEEKEEQWYAAGHSFATDCAKRKDLTWRDFELASMDRVSEDKIEELKKSVIKHQRSLGKNIKISKQEQQIMVLGFTEHLDMIRQDLGIGL